MPPNWAAFFEVKMGKLIIVDNGVNNKDSPHRPLKAGETALLLTINETEQTADFTALANYSYSVNSTAGVIKVKLPSTAENGATITLQDTGSVAAIKNITIRNSTDTATLGVLDVNSGVITLSYNTIIGKWVVIYKTPLSTLTYSGSVISALASGTTLGNSSASPLTIMSVTLPVAGTYQITGYFPYLSSSAAKVIAGLSIGGSVVSNTNTAGTYVGSGSIEAFFSNTWQVTVGAANTTVSFVQWTNNGSSGGTLLNNASNGFAQMTYELISVPPQMSYSSFITKASAIVNAGGEVVLGNLKARIPTSGNRSLQIATVSGTYSVYGGCTFANNANVGAARIPTSSPLNVTTTFAYLNSANNFDYSGDVCTWLITDAANNISWRLSFIIGDRPAYTNNTISIEQLL